MRTLRNVVLSAAATCAAGCSVLTVDIDVYKGPLGSDEELQVRQFAALPAAARPLLVELRDALQKQYMATQPAGGRRPPAGQAGKNTYLSTEMLGEAVGARFVNEALSAYYDKNVLETLDRANLSRLMVGRESDGIDTLLNKLIAAYSNPDAATRYKEVLKERVRLENALVTFATRITYFADNRYLLRLGLSEETVSEGEARMTALLQALGNTILVQVDDFSRKRRYTKGQEALEPVERQAYREAREISPAQSLARMAQHIAGKRAAADAALKALPAGATNSPARDALAAAQREKGLLDAKAAAAKADLEAALGASKPAYAAFQTITGHKRDVAGKDLSAADPAVLTDKDEVTKALNAVAKPDRDTIHAALVAWIADALAKQKTADADKPGPRVQRLALAAEYFKDKSALPDLAADKTSSDHLAALRERVRGEVEKIQAAYAKAQPALAAATKAVEAFQPKLAAAEAKAKEEASAAKKSDTAASEAKSKADALADAERAFAAVREELSKPDAKLSGEPTAVLERVKARLKERATAEPAKADSYKAATAALDGLVFLAPGSSIVDVRTTPSGRHPTAKDVLDDGITLLRQQEIQAEANGEKVRAGNIRSAIERALKQRADMAYLRPPQAYLRSIYTASALQAEVDRPGANLLLRQLVGAPLGFRGGQEERYQDAREQLDKLSWQNINTVRVTGGGAANYVVAKDDVGNWYVKGFDADPTEIYKSVRSMALFNYGRQIDVDLLRRLDVERMLDDPQTGDTRRAELKDELSKLKEEPSRRGTDALGSAIARYQKDYRDGARKHVTDLNEALSRMQDTLAPGWGKLVADAAISQAFVDRLKALTPATDANLVAANAALQAADTEDSSAEARNDAIVVTLQRLRRFQFQTVAAIRGDPTLLGLFGSDAEAQKQAVNARATAADQLDAHLAGVSSRTVRARLDAIRQYETALTIIGDVTK